MAFTNASGFLSHPLEHVNRRLAEQQGLLKAVQTALPSELAAHSRHCLDTGQKLMLFTESAVWAVQLRFHEAQLLAAATAYLKRPFTQLHIKILVDTLGPNTSLFTDANRPSAQALAYLNKACPAKKGDELAESWQKLILTLLKSAT